MKALLVLLIHLVAVLARLAGPGGVRWLVAENLLMKGQLLILSRSRQRAPNLSSPERFVLGFCTLLVSPGRIPRVAAGVRASTLHKLHQCLVRRKYRALFSARRSRRRPGPKGPSEELVRAIVEIKRRNPLFGCPRIALIISTTFGVEVDKDVVRRVLEKHLRPGPGGGGPSWLTVIGHAKDSLWSVDLFRCESILLKTHWVLVVLDQFTRRIIGFAVHVGNVDGLSLCRMFHRVISRHALARYLSTDHDPLFRYHRWQANLPVLDIEPVKTVSYVPVSHPFVERLIGSVRREFLDQTLFWNSLDRERKLGSFRDSQRKPSSQLSWWPDAGRGERETRKAAGQHPRASMAVALWRALSTPRGRVATNSPGTGCSLLPMIANQQQFTHRFILW
jgi:transposase InsO family protein